MKQVTTATIMCAMMVATSIAATVLRPKPRDPSLPPAIVLADAVPKQFGNWRELPAQAVQVVNPQTQELLDKLYSQTLTRTYVNAEGYVIMLSMAYGDDQRGGLQAHMPEVCYPAQGFKLESATAHQVPTPFGNITGKRLVTTMGPRTEPITYWFSMGQQAVQTRWEKRMVEIRLGLTGQVPDGLLFRISSIDADEARAFASHENFIKDLLLAQRPNERKSIAGV